MLHINAGKQLHWQYCLNAVRIRGFSITQIKRFNISISSFRKPIKCGDVIRLQHLSTSKNLHSHHFSSPLSNNQEISCYGEEGIYKKELFGKSVFSRACNHIIFGIDFRRWWQWWSLESCLLRRFLDAFKCSEILSHWYRRLFVSEWTNIWQVIWNFAFTKTLWKYIPQNTWFIYWLLFQL